MTSTGKAGTGRRSSGQESRPDQPPVPSPSGLWRAGSVSDRRGSAPVAVAPGSPCGSLSLAFPIDARGVRPQFFQGVILTHVRIEHVHDHIAVVLHDPATALVTLDRHASIAVVTQSGVNLFGDGM